MKIINEQYRQFASESARITDEITGRREEFELLRYSLIWGIFSFLSSGRGIAARAEQKAYMPVLGVNPGKHCIISGNIDSSLISAIKAAGISVRTVRITNRNIGMVNAKRIVFPRTFRKQENIRAELKGMHGIESAVGNIIDNNYSDIIRFRDFLVQLFIKERPLFILLDEDRTKFKKTMTIAAGAAGIRTYVLQHGITPAVTDSGVPLADESFTPLFADRFLCWGRTSEKYMINAGNNTDAVIKAGNPSLEFKAGNQGKGVLVIDQQFQAQEDERNEAYSILTDELDREKIDYSIYLRDTHNLEYLRRNHPAAKLIEWKKGRLIQEMDKCEAVLGFHSSALIEAMMRGKPVISYDYAGRGDIIGINGKSGAVAVPGTLRQTLASLSREEADIRSDLEQHIEYSGKNAVHRIMDIIGKENEDVFH